MSKPINVLPPPANPEALTIEHLHQLGKAYEESYHHVGKRLFRFFCCSSVDRDTADMLVNYNRTPYSSYEAWLLLTDIVQKEKVARGGNNYFYETIISYCKSAFGLNATSSYDALVSTIVSYYNEPASHQPLCH